jgi:hypothetical protein
MAMTMIPGKAGESAIRAEQAAQDASKSVPTTTTVDPVIEKAQQANKDLAPEAIAKTVAVEPTVTPPKDAEHAQIAEVGHEMGTERGERRVIKETSIRLTPEEKAIVNSFASPAEKAKIAGAIRATKVRYPVSDGWLPLELVGAELNEKGLPELQWKQPAYGFNRGVQEVDKVVKDSSGNPITYPATDRSGVVKLDDYGDPIERALKLPVKEERSMKRGTTEYDKAVNKATNNSYKEIEDVIRRAAEGDDAAKVILRQVGWYREFMRKGFDERGGAYPAFSDILGATSPNTAVDQNYAYTVDAQKRFARGDFDPQVDFASKYEGSLTAFPEDQLIRRTVVDPKTGELKQYGMNSRNAQMAMADLWRQQEEGQAPKARNFSGNLGGATDAATIDVWAARHIQRMLGRKRLPPPAEGGVKGKMMMTAPDNPVGPYGPMPMTLKAGGEFGFGQDVYGKLADKVNKNQILRPYLEQLGYTDITPMDLQALTWFIEKEHWTKNNWTTKAGEGGSFEDEMSKFPSRRWQSGFSISQGDTPPTNEMMAQTRNVVEGSLKNDDEVMVYRVHPTYGRYGGYDERSFDVELTAKPDWNPTNWMASIISEAQKNNQYDVFFSKRLDPSESITNPNARPGVEIYFQNRKDMDEILPILDEFTRRGQDGFTFTTDLRHRERMSGGADSPDYVGVRLQYVPEIRMRFDEDFRNAVVNDPQVLQNDLKSALRNMQNAINALDRSGAKIVDARVHHYDTLAVGKESYDDFLKGIADLENASSEYERSARGTNPVARFGRPISSHVEGRNRALREGYGQAAPDTSAAMEQPNLGVIEPDKSRGGTAFANGGRSLGNNAIDNALRMARSMGRNGDTILAHINPQEAALLKALGGSGKINPRTGLPEFGFDDRPERGATGSSGSTGYNAGYGGGSPSSTPSSDGGNDGGRGGNDGPFGGNRPSGGNDSIGGGRGINELPGERAAYKEATSVDPLAFGKNFDVSKFSTTDANPENIREWTEQRMTSPFEGSLLDAAMYPGNVFGMGYPSTVNKEFTRAGASGLLGNAQFESGLNPTAMNQIGATGIFQNLGSRKTGLLDTLGIDPMQDQAAIKEQLKGTTLPQLGYGINEIASINAYKPTLKAMETAKDPYAASDVVMKNFERPSELEQFISGPIRAAYSNQIMAGVPSAATTPLGSPDVPARSGSPATQNMGSNFIDAAKNIASDVVSAPKSLFSGITSGIDQANRSYMDQLLSQPNKVAVPTFDEEGNQYQWPNTVTGQTKEEYAKQFTGGDPSKVQERISYMNGVPQVEYYAKSLGDALFGGFSGGNKAARSQTTAQGATPTTDASGIRLGAAASLFPEANRAQIAQLERQGQTTLFPDEYSRQFLTDEEGNTITPKEWYRQDMERQLGRPVSMDEVMSGIQNVNGQQRVNYFVKDPDTAMFEALMPGGGVFGALKGLFGNRTQEEQIQDAVSAARSGRLRPYPYRYE